MSEEFKQELERVAKREQNPWNSGYNGMEHRLNQLAIREIFEMKHEVNSLRDENGTPIVGTGRVVTNEEKKMVFDYILDNNYPLTRKMYMFILKGYLNGEMELVPNNEEKKGMTR